MTRLIRPAALATLALVLSSCAGRTAFKPENGPPTVGMPAELSNRERGFMPSVESALRSRGYVPVRHGAGDMELEFTIAEGPINTDTRIELSEQGRPLASGKGRAAGAPMIGRTRVAEKSFQRAFSEFEGALPGGSGGRHSAAPDPAPAGDGAEYVY